MSLDAQADLIVHSTVPFNAEPPLDRLRHAFVTATRDFYVRSHGAVPAVDAAAYRLRVEGRGARAALPLARRASVPLRGAHGHGGHAMRRQPARRPAAGATHHPATLGRPAPSATREWTGVSLADVLRAAGAADVDDLHVAFDRTRHRRQRGRARTRPMASPSRWPRRCRADVLLAWAMNGAPLAPEHGAPLRIVVPGYAGVRSAKWVSEIRVQDTPSDAFQQAKDYLLFPSDMRHDTQDLSARGTAIDAMPLNAAICDPAAGDERCRSARPAVSAATPSPPTARSRASTSPPNGGRRMAPGRARGPVATRRWSWTLWHATLDIPRRRARARCARLGRRRADPAGAQPDDTWNFKGYLSAAWHRVRVTAA